jgi:hypothetical protein
MTLQLNLSPNDRVTGTAPHNGMSEAHGCDVKPDERCCGMVSTFLMEVSLLK